MSMFSRTVPQKTTGSWGMIASRGRRSASDKLLMSSPSITCNVMHVLTKKKKRNTLACTTNRTIAPDSGSTRRKSAAKREDFPEPVRPTTCSANNTHGHSDGSICLDLILGPIGPRRSSPGEARRQVFRLRPRISRRRGPAASLGRSACRLSRTRQRQTAASLPSGALATPQTPATTSGNLLEISREWTAVTTTRQLCCWCRPCRRLLSQLGAARAAPAGAPLHTCHAMHVRRACVNTMDKQDMLALRTTPRTQGFVRLPPCVFRLGPSRRSSRSS
jgi:hypothetical protein